ncbi:phospholipase D family protein [bacterium]|nr:MAG: phospholipase D family protein [bacterium]
MGNKGKKSTGIAIIIIALVLLLVWEHFADGSDNPTYAVQTRECKITPLFSPDDDCSDAIVDCINNAQKTVDVSIYTFTSRPISNALVRANKRGVSVRVIMDREQSAGHYSKKRYLHNSGIPVRVHIGDGLMHNKFAVIDTQIVITGSYNWTASAQKYNFENIVIIESPEVAKIYQKEFGKLWKKFE